MSPRWWLPSHFERRHIGRWLSRCWHWRITYPLDTYTAGVLEDLQATADKAFDDLMDKVEQSILDNMNVPRELVFRDIDLSGSIVDSTIGTKVEPLDLSPGFIDMQHYRVTERVDNSPWLLGYRKGFGSAGRFSPWQRTCVYSECCDAPVYRRTNFLQMRAFHWCPKCETLLTTVDTEAVFDMLNGVGESFVDNDFYV